MPIFKAWLRLTRQNRPIGTILLLCPALWSVWIATSGQPDWRDVFIIIFCAWLTRSAGCAINDWADRKIDGKVARTKNRPLVSGELPASSALWTCGVMLLIALGSSFYLSYTVLWWLLPTAMLIALYPFTKRFFILPQLVLAMTFAMAVPISWYAVQGTVNVICGLLITITIAWVFAYDTIYALCDFDDDLQIGVHSSAQFFGSNSQMAIVLFHTLVLAGFWLLGQHQGWYLEWYLTLMVMALSFAYQHYLIHRASAGDLMKAFTHNGCLGLMVFIGIICSVQ